MPSPLSVRRGLLTPRYVGPLDIHLSGWLHASGVRRLSRRYTGPLAQIRESGGDTLADIYATRTGGLNATAAALHIGANSGFYAKQYDQSGTASDAVQATTANQPSYIELGQNERPTVRYSSASGAIRLAANAVATALSGADKPFTIIAPVHARSLATAATVWCLGRSSSANPFCRLELSTTPNFFVVRRDDSTASKNLTSGTPVISRPYITRTVFDGTTGKLFIDGTQVGSDTDLDVGTLTLDLFSIGAFTRTTVANMFNGDIPEILVNSAALSNAVCEAIEANMRAFYNPGPLTLFICDGDSRTIGEPGTVANSYPSQLSTLLGGARVENLGVGGRTLATIDGAAHRAEVVAYLSPPWVREVYIISGGYNDMRAGGGNVDPDTAADTMKSICEYFTTQGATVIAVTEQDCKPAADGGVDRADIDAFNARMVSDFAAGGATYAAALCRLDLDPDIGVAGTHENTDYFADGVHSTTAGYAIKASVIRNTIAQQGWA